MISSRQIKAARSLLGWTQSELAKASGVHLNAINKIETEASEPRSSTLERIKAACEVAGIRFRGQRGVEIKEDVFDVARFEGPDFMRRLLDDALPFLHGPADEVLFCVVDDRFFESAASGQVARYYLHMKKKGFRERGLMRKKATTFLNKDKTVYRWLPEKALGVVAFMVYGNRVAYIQWKTQEILLIKNKPLAETYRNQFDFMWAQAKPFASE